MQRKPDTLVTRAIGVALVALIWALMARTLLTPDPLTRAATSQIGEVRP